MKRIIILIGVLVSLLAAEVVWAQATEGVISYETKMDLHRRLPPERAEMKAMIPQFRTTKDNLYFNANESIYKPVIEDEDEDGAGGGGVVMRFGMPNNEFYTNRETSRTISKQEFMGKDYLIEDSVKVSPWKFGTETREILGYKCQQAYYTAEVKAMAIMTVRTSEDKKGDEKKPDTNEAKEKQEITVWYTTELRPFLGPGQHNTLPGAILAVDVNNGERVTVAKKIDFRPLKKNELKMPTSGTKTTQAEYRKMVDEKMKEMRANGGMMIRN